MHALNVIIRRSKYKGRNDRFNTEARISRIIHEHEKKILKNNITLKIFSRDSAPHRSAHRQTIHNREI